MTLTFIIVKKIRSSYDRSNRNLAVNTTYTAYKQSKMVQTWNDKLTVVYWNLFILNFFFCSFSYKIPRSSPDDVYLCPLFNAKQHTTVLWHISHFVFFLVTNFHIFGTHSGRSPCSETWQTCFIRPASLVPSSLRCGEGENGICDLK